MDITAGIVSILNMRHEIAGTGFVVSDDGLLITCAHVLKKPYPDRVNVKFLVNNKEREAAVERQWLRGEDAEDIALLRVVGSMPQGVRSLPLGPSAGLEGHEVCTFGFPRAGDVEGVAGYGRILVRGSQTRAGQPLIQIRSSEITSGFSGAPIWDELRQRVIGMVVLVERPDSISRMGETAFATPAETLQSVCKVLQISNINPYFGLRVFTENCNQFFFGRQQYIDRIVNKLCEGAQFLVISGPSGSGKSSLVQAGLIPRLRNAEVPNSDHWEILITRPADNPFKQLALIGLDIKSKNLTEVVRTWLSLHPKRSALVLIIDSFEELLANCTKEVSQNYIMQLAMLLDAHLPFTLIVVIRDDFYSQIAQNMALKEMLERSQDRIVLSPTLQKDELIDIVERPAKSVGLRFEPGMVEKIIEDTMETTFSEKGERLGRSAILPLLEFALTELCARHEDGVLTLKAYDQIGGVTGGLRQWADQVIRSLEDEQKIRLTARIFTDLIHLGDGQRLLDSLRRRPLKDLYRNETEREKVYKLVQHLVDTRLLVTSYDMQSNEVIVEIIHDALLQDWRWLKNWVERDRLFLTWHQELERKALTWAKSDSKDTRYFDRFLKGSSLSDAERYMKERATDLRQVEQDLIKESRALQTGEEQNYEQLYKEAKQQREEALRQKQEAERQREEALRQKQEAERQREEALRQKQEAERQHLIALANQLTAQAELIRNQQGNLLQRSVLLALEAVQRSASLEADQTLRDGLTLLPRPVTHLSPRDSVMAVALSTDGRYLVSAYKDGTLEIWDTTGNCQVAQLSHQGAVKQIVFSSNNNYFVIAETDSTLRVRETSSGRQIAHLSNKVPFQAFSLSSDGRYLATSSSDGVAWIWDVIRSYQLCHLTHDGIIYSTSFSSDGCYLATACVDGTVRIWNVMSGREVVLLNHPRSVRIVAFSPDGRYLATASDDDVVRLWLWASQNDDPLAILPHARSVNALVFHPDSSYLATVSRDYSARIWETSSGRFLVRMTHQGSINSLSFCTDGRFLATTSSDHTVGIWETLSGYRLVCLPHIGRDYVDAVAFSADGRSFTTVKSNGTADVWEIINNRFTHTRCVSTVTFSADGYYLITASEDGTAGVWETRSGYRHLNLFHGSKVWAAAFNPDGRSLATGSEDGIIRLWKTPDGHQTVQVAHKKSVNSVAFSPDGRYLATASSDSTAKIWGTTSGKLLYDLPHNDVVNALAFSSDGRSLATASNDTYARVWETARGNLLFELPHRQIVNSVTFSPDGHYLATASWDHTARVWDVTTGLKIWRLLHESKVWAVVFSPDNKYLATASKDRSARVWEVSSGKQLVRLAHDESVSAVTFSPDGKFLATASEDHTARIWEFLHGRLVACFTHADSVRTVAFSPDGKYIATAGMDGIARIWLLRSADLIAEACTRLTRNLTTEEWQQYLGEETYQKTCARIPEHTFAEDISR